MPLGPQVTEQEPQSAQSVTWQSFGQAWVLHSWFWTFSVQALPPNWLLWVVGVVRYCVPVPQDCVQVVQLRKGRMAQSTGHLWVLQASVVARAGQWRPPWLRLSTTERVFFWTPVPQVLEQPAESSCQSETVQ
jgi:hypothetical protein